MLFLLVILLFISISDERIQRIMTFNEFLLLFFNLLITRDFFFKKNKDFGTTKSRNSSLKTVLLKSVTLRHCFAKGSHVIYYVTSHRTVYSLKNREIYEKEFWVRMDYVLFRDISTTMPDSFYCYYVRFIIALVEQDHLLK